MAMRALPLVLLAAAPCSSAAPHVLFLMVDQMDGRVLDPASPLHAIPALPNLRGLAAKGASFTNTYITSPQCVPSRSAMVVWDNSRGIVAVDGNASRLDPHCVDEYGSATCAEWAARAPQTFVDVLSHKGVNITKL
eukprot:gene37588-57791_t